MALTLADLFKWGESTIPECDETIIPSISTTQLSKQDIANEGAREWVRLTKCLPSERKFDCVSGIYSYSITENVPDFGEMRPEGMWHLRSDSSANTWDPLTPTTQRRLDQKYRTWRTQANSDYVRDYYQDGDIWGVFYTPSSSVTNGFWAYYYATASDMSNTTDYPFTASRLSTRLEPFHKHVLTYYEAKALEIIGYRDDSLRKMTEFYNQINLAKTRLAANEGLEQSSQARARVYKPRFRR